ncbi:endonuclease/exonuclease/phosphatase family protein [Oricola sp.]|uniref:endonuclease/exonuclease/phosphatase family protein n=1 Tax=Oricola sp. TaxID=1979950 RepID=UPI003517E48F
MFRTIFVRLSAAAVVLLAIPTGFSLFNRLAPQLDSLAHLRLHLAAALATAAILAVFLGARRMAAVGGLTVAATLIVTYPYLPGFSPGSGSSANASPRSIRVLQLNTLFNNAQTDLAAGIIRAADPDVVFLQEVTDSPKALINLLKNDYPVQLRCGSSSIGGATVISRLPAATDKIDCIESFALSAIRLDVDGKAMTFASYHGLWPWPFNQQEGIDKLTGQFSALPHPLVLAGDFNAATWSEGVHRIARLTDTSPAPGARSTWLSQKMPNALRPLIGLPIDQIMVSDEFTITSITTLPFAGSDHLPVVADIAF